MNVYLFIILIVSGIGMLFSGILSYIEVFKKRCDADRCTMIARLPVCVYGFLMFLIVFIISLLGLLN